MDAFHRNHVGIESIIKPGKDLGLRRMPGYAFAFNQAWCTPSRPASSTTPASEASAWTTSIPTTPT
jgi:hypothetical protein